MKKETFERSILIFLFSAAAFGETCTYHTWTWDTFQKKSVGHRTVRKLYTELDVEERGKIKGCSVCEEDQVSIRMGKLPEFKICRVFAEPIRQALQRAVDAGFSIESLIGYRVGKSKGRIDPSGLRTEFSNHSFGTAIDINSDKNGLYDNCTIFGAKCLLLRGGRYTPSVPGTITAGSPIYEAFRDGGFHWGGEIAGRQKDFMHFSLDGM